MGGHDERLLGGCEILKVTVTRAQESLVDVAQGLVEDQELARTPKEHAERQALLLTDGKLLEKRVSKSRELDRRRKRRVSGPTRR